MPATAAQLADLLVGAAAPGTAEDAARAARLLVEHLAQTRRLSLLPRVIRAVDLAWRRRFGVSHVRVRSAFPLVKEDVARLKEAAPGADFTAAVDASLIGGAVVRLDDRLLDGSISGALARLKEDLVRGT